MNIRLRASSLSFIPIENVRENIEEYRTDEIA